MSRINYQALVRKQEREAIRRQKEFQKQLKEQAKLSQWEQARLEVQTFENQLEVLLSIHKERSSSVDWADFASSLPPHYPLRIGRHESVVAFKQSVAPSDSYQLEFDEARRLDQQENELAYSEYEKEFSQWNEMQILSLQVIEGESNAYFQAISRFSALSELSTLGSSINLTTHGRKLIECVVKVKGMDVIPTETKSLTAAGKVSVKVMPKAKFNEIYQDYVCGSVFRIAQEILAVLPVDNVLITATVDGLDTRTGQPAELPILSVITPRTIIARLDFQRLDPSDALENFVYRGEVKTSKRTGEFMPIDPLKPEEIPLMPVDAIDFAHLIQRIQQLRNDIKGSLKVARPEITTVSL